MIVKPEEIKRWSDYQINWAAVIEPLRKGRYTVESTEQRSIHGDAPKSFIRIKEYVPGHSNSKVRRWPGYIAKLGSKRYPVESITEHLFTRFGQTIGVDIAQSKLRIVAGQVRFLSRFFLRENESLVHGLEIFRRHLDDELVDEIAESRQEQEFYTFQTVVAAVNDIYPDHLDAIMRGMVELLCFDAIVGNNDRHPLNWGVIVPLAKSRPIRFAPIFDSARGMFWNLDDCQLEKFAQSEQSLRAYVGKSYPQIGWDGCQRINHFDLIHRIFSTFPEYRENMAQFVDDQKIGICVKLVDEEFGELMSPIRRHVICGCLRERHKRFCESLV